MASVPEEAKTKPVEPAVAGPPPMVTSPSVDTTPPPDVDEADSMQRIFEDISVAQAKVLKLGKSPAALHKHMQQVLYPLMTRVVGLSMDLRDAVRGIAADVAEPEEYLSGENIEFIAGYIEAVFAFVLKYGAWARQQAAAGNPDFQRDLSAIYQGGSALKEVLQGLAESGDAEVEEVVDE